MKLDTEALTKALKRLGEIQKEADEQKGVILRMLPVRTGDAVFYGGNPGKVVRMKVVGPPFWVKVSVAVVVGRDEGDYENSDIDRVGLRFPFVEDGYDWGQWSSTHDEKKRWAKLTFFPQREKAVEDPLQRPDMEGY